LANYLVLVSLLFMDVFCITSPPDLLLSTHVAKVTAVDFVSFDYWTNFIYLKAQPYFMGVFSGTYVCLLT